MKNSFDLERQLNSTYFKILNYDKQEIDNPIKYHFTRLNYLDRIKTIISIIKKNLSLTEQSKIGDFACAQGNISLILAELGYKVFAIDINSTYLEYSKMKYEKGEIEWLTGNIDNLDFPENMLDAAIVGELIEHCAYPEQILEKIFKFVKPGGLVILSTPNGARIKNKLPTFKQVYSNETRGVFKERQFGPDDKDHLFLFKLEELRCILPKNAKIIKKGYLGGTILVNKYSWPFLKFIPIKTVEGAIRMLSEIPLINTKLFNNIYAVIRKNPPAEYNAGQKND